MPVSDTELTNPKHKTREKAAAWAVHSFTTSGIVLGFLGLVAVFEGKQRETGEETRRETGDETSI